MPQTGDFIQDKNIIGEKITILDKWSQTKEVGLSFSGTILESGVSYFSTADGVLLSQHIQFLETHDFGVIFILDGSVMTVGRPEMEASYHEMITHVPLIEHVSPKRVLIIGGGDGGVAREVLKHLTVEQCVLVEIDPNVVAFAKKYIPSISSALLEKDSRLQVLVQDGIRYLRDIQPASFDVIINDLTDPDEGNQVSEKLFGAEFYHNVYQALAPDGIIMTLGQSCVADNPEVIRDIHNNITSSFSNTVPLLNGVIMYQPDFLFFMAAKDPKKRWNDLRFSQQQRQSHVAKQTVIYNEDMHRSAYILKNYVRDMLESKELRVRPLS